MTSRTLAAAALGAAALAALLYVVLRDRVPDAPAASSAPAAAKDELAATAVAASAGAAAKPARAAAGPAPGNPAPASAVDRALLLDGIRSFGRAPRDEGWYAGAVERLRASPDDCAALVELYASPDLDVRARALILDLLTQVGHAKAQAAMRAIFDLPVAKGDANFDNLVRRFGDFDHPEPETVAYAGGLYGAESGQRRLAAADGFATALGKLRRDGSPAWESHNARLLADLAAAKDPGERNALIGAIGRTGLDENTGALLERAKDPEPSTRAAVAIALRDVHGPRATEGLLALAADESTAVRNGALASLSARALAAGELDALARLVAAGTLGPDNDASLLHLLSKQEASTRAVLGAMLKRGVKEAHLRAEVERLLAGG